MVKSLVDSGSVIICHSWCTLKKQPRSLMLIMVNLETIDNQKEESLKLSIILPLR